MAILHRPLTSFPLPIPSLLLPRPRSKTLSLPSLPLKPVRSYLPAPVFCCSSSPPTTEQELLDAIARSDSDHVLPCVRTYEGDLARLTLVGAVDFEQALTAAAADGGGAAGEHVDAGMDTMVVETVFPGPPEDRSTVSTRLFLPARKVKEKARKLKRSFSDEMLTSTTSSNILAMTFRQVVLQHLWSFQLIVFGPGTWRNMDDLESPREVRLQIDSERLEDLKLEGWKQLLENRWEVVLSHSQMVGLTNILDMFYEDAYTLPAKELGCNIVVNPSSLSNSKRGSSLVQMLTIALAGGILAIAIRTFSQSYLPHVQKLIKCLQEHRSLPPSSETAN
ncbi:hypothetical protein CDL15_Pgr016794 [Punica granatum]|uniref:Uncharacterized protein n=1 Tax=Punica granatum TaxID=22663 RepID=A0A218WX75_PUNGR|nr:hypothetical protein CDL15_Pgr016794 [Punica granatum]PKI76198.1 hypothetical protein CRG98_003425 [Punica granatum]